MADYRPNCIKCGMKGTNNNNSTPTLCSYCKAKLGAYSKPIGKRYLKFLKQEGI